VLTRYLNIQQDKGFVLVEHGSMSGTWRCWLIGEAHCELDRYDNSFLPFMKLTLACYLSLFDSGSIKTLFFLLMQFETLNVACIFVLIDQFMQIDLDI
jgi:hypothetical protein